MTLVLDKELGARQAQDCLLGSCVGAQWAMLMRMQFRRIAMCALILAAASTFLVGCSQSEAGTDESGSTPNARARSEAVLRANVICRGAQMTLDEATADLTSSTDSRAGRSVARDLSHLARDLRRIDGLDDLIRDIAVLAMSFEDRAEVHSLPATVRRPLTTVNPQYRRYLDALSRGERAATRSNLRDCIRIT